MININTQKSRYCFLKKRVAGLKFFKKSQKTVFCSLLFSAFSAQASFVSQCTIDAIVLEDTSGIRAYMNDKNGREYEKQSITVKVQVEKISDPATVACQNIKVGASLDVFIDRVNWSTLKKGQKITFNRLYKTYAEQTEPAIFYHGF